MRPSPKWQRLGWRHPVWDLVRYYLNLSPSRRVAFLETGKTHGRDALNVPAELLRTLREYLREREAQLNQARTMLRTEEQALEFCRLNRIQVLKTATKNKSHHQSSKALVATVSSIATHLTTEARLSCEPNPQSRCIWIVKGHYHVTSRNIDGAVPSLRNPLLIWEIKEYWGKTKGGSKMSDAVYECNLVGRELREFEERADIKVVHVVFVDGKDQWAARVSDLARFLDLENQGIIDFLFVGREVEKEWSAVLGGLIENAV